ncbi:MAG TPA: hypothetical protein VK154_08040 [Chitinophagales bacterium]|nr:hypothetical protein [Chitinophagales bacterium]
MKTATHIISLLAIICLMVSCNKSEIEELETHKTTANHKTLTIDDSDGMIVRNMTPIQVFFHWHAFTVMLTKAIDEPAVFAAPEKREPNEIFVYDDESSSRFRPIISALADPGTYMLWREMQIVFNPGFEPRQFYSRDEVMEASQAPNPIITFVPTGVVYEGRKFNAVDAQPVLKSVAAN